MLPLACYRVFLVFVLAVVTACVEGTSREFDLCTLVCVLLIWSRLLYASTRSRRCFLAAVPLMTPRLLMTNLRIGKIYSMAFCARLFSVC